MPARKNAGIGAIIRQARLSRGIKQKHLAQKSGVSQSMISHLERGRYENLSVVTIVAIEKALGEPRIDLIAALTGRMIDSDSLDRFLSSEVYKELAEPLSAQEIADLRVQAAWYGPNQKPSPVAWLHFVQAWRSARRTSSH